MSLKSPPIIPHISAGVDLHQSIGLCAKDRLLELSSIEQKVLLNGYTNTLLATDRKEIQSDSIVAEQQDILLTASRKIAQLSHRTHRPWLTPSLDLPCNPRSFDSQLPLGLNKQTTRSITLPHLPADLRQISISRKAAYSSSGSLIGSLNGVPPFFVPSLSAFDPISESVDKKCTGFLNVPESPTENHENISTNTDVVIGLSSKALNGCSPFVFANPPKSNSNFKRSNDKTKRKSARKLAIFKSDNNMTSNLREDVTTPETPHSASSPNSKKTVVKITSVCRTDPTVEFSPKESGLVDDGVSSSYYLSHSDSSLLSSSRSPPATAAVDADLMRKPVYSFESSQPADDTAFTIVTNKKSKFRLKKPSPVSSSSASSTVNSLYRRRTDFMKLTPPAQSNYTQLSSESSSPLEKSSISCKTSSFKSNSQLPCSSRWLQPPLLLPDNENSPSNRESSNLSPSTSFSSSLEISRTNHAPGRKTAQSKLVLSKSNKYTSPKSDSTPSPLMRHASGSAASDITCSEHSFKSTNSFPSNFRPFNRSVSSRQTNCDVQKSKLVGKTDECSTSQHIALTHFMIEAWNTFGRSPS